MRRSTFRRHALLTCSGAAAAAQESSRFEYSHLCSLTTLPFEVHRRRRWWLDAPRATTLSELLLLAAAAEQRPDRKLASGLVVAFDAWAPELTKSTENHCQISESRNWSRSVGNE